MDPKKIKDFLNRGADTSLSEEERQRIRSTLVSFMASHPVRGGEMERLYMQRPNYSPFLFKFMPIISAIMIAALLGGGVSSAAEATLPGDKLYPIKTHINETVRGWTAISAKAQAEWQVQLAERRLEEAGRLAAEDRLNSEIQAELSKEIERNSREANRKTEKLKEKDEDSAVEVSSRLEIALNAHGKVLQNLRAEATLPLTSIIRQVDSETRNAQEARAEAEARISIRKEAELRALAEAKMKVAEEALARAKKSLAEQGDRISSEIRLEAETEIQAAEKSWKEGEAKWESQAYGEAFLSFQTAIRASQEANLLIKTGKELRVRVLIQDNSNRKNEKKEDKQENRNRPEDDGRDQNKDNDAAGQIRVELKNGLEAKTEEDREPNQRQEKTEIKLEAESSVKIPGEAELKILR